MGSSLIVCSVCVTFFPFQVQNGESALGRNGLHLHAHLSVPLGRFASQHCFTATTGYVFSGLAVRLCVSGVEDY